MLISGAYYLARTVILRGAIASIALGIYLAAIVAPSLSRAQVTTPVVDGWGENFFDRTTLDEAIPTEKDFEISPPLLLEDKMSDVRPVYSDTISPELNGWIRWLVLKNIPTAYKDDKHWNQQKDVVRSIDWQRDGWRLKPVPVHKKVNHGTWTRYAIDLLDPANQLKLAIVDLHTIRDRAIAFDIIVEAPLKAFGRLSQWQRDIQLVSISVNAEADVRLTAHCEVGVILNPLQIPPAVSFEPHVTQAHVELVRFRVTRISQIGGPLAKHLGTTLREVIEDRLKDYDDKLTDKINRQLDKQKDKLTLSSQAWMQTTFSKWVEESKEKF